MNKTKSGFTIVELLIVIVVIGILAAITVVAFNGVQTRANTAGALSDLKQVNSAIQLYYVDNGAYPNTSGNWQGINKEANYIPELTPTYLPSLPQSKMPDRPASSQDAPQTVTAYKAVYMYKSNGTDYKLIAHVDGLCSSVKAQRPNMIDATRTYSAGCWAYGYWTPGAVSF